jgi:hypothetical protein
LRSHTFAVLKLIFCDFSSFVPGFINSTHNSILSSIFYCAFWCFDFVCFVVFCLFFCRKFWMGLKIPQEHNCQFDNIQQFSGCYHTINLCQHQNKNIIIYDLLYSFIYVSFIIQFSICYLAYWILSLAATSTNSVHNLILYITTNVWTFFLFNCTPLPEGVPGVE